MRCDDHYMQSKSFTIKQICKKVYQRNPNHIKVKSTQRMSNSFETVLPELVKTIRCASSLGAQDVKFYHSLDSQLANSLDTSTGDLLELADRLIKVSSVDQDKDISADKGSFTWKPITDILDSLYEKVDIMFDNALPTKGRDNNQLTYLEDGNEDSRAPTRAISKPQLEFRIPIDNSESHPFRPKLTSKPNALKSFDESMTMIGSMDKEEEDLLPHYEHPYEYEIDTQPYPETILEETVVKDSQDWSTTSAIWVDTSAKLEDMIASLSTLTEIAVDLEHHDYRSYYGLVCLMQISNREQDWIVDTLALRNDLEPLNSIFTNPNIVKVFHGAFMDIIWLQRDLGLYVVSLFDTYHASKKLGFPKFSLAYLLETYANFKTSKKYQLADWRVRPLLAPMMAYARSDTHFLLNIYDQLKNKLIQKGNGRLQEVLYESRQVCKRRFEYTKFRPTTGGSNVVCPVMSSNPNEPFGNIMSQYRVPYHKLPLVRVLYEWRDQLAKSMDESVRFIMPNQLLVNLSLLSLPIDSSKVLSSSSFISDSVRANSKELAILIDATIKEMDETDWDLVDKLTSTIETDTEFFKDGKPDQYKIHLTTQAFEKLIDATQLSTTESDNILLNKNSSLLSDIFINERDQFSVEFNIENDSVIRHPKTITKSREQVLLDHLNAINEASLKPISDSNLKVENVIQVEHPVQEKPAAQVEQKMDNEEKEDDLITLRKKQIKTKERSSDEGHYTNQPAFDYSNADKIMLEKNKNMKKDRRPKRSFDPYGSTGDGPQAAKKTRRENSGKTSTFSKRNK